MRLWEYILDKPITLGASRVLLITLQRHLLQFPEREEDVSKIVLSDTEVDVSDIKAMEGSTIGTSCGTALTSCAGSAILLCLGKLGDDRDSFEFLASQLQSLGNGFFFLELNVTDTR